MATANIVKLKTSRDTFGERARISGKYAALDFPPITETEVEFLQRLMSDWGSIRVAKWMKVSEGTALRVAAGLGFKCRPDTMASIREFFAVADLKSAKRGIGPDGRDSPQKRGIARHGKREGKR